MIKGAFTMSPITRIRSLVLQVHMPHLHLRSSSPVVWLDRVFSSRNARIILAISVALFFLLLAIWLSAGTSGVGTGGGETDFFYYGP
jgi:ABC-type uncharacterized transport system YnjBCD permease subunit